MVYKKTCATKKKAEDQNLSQLKANFFSATLIDIIYFLFDNARLSS